MLKKLPRKDVLWYKMISIGYTEVIRDQTLSAIYI
jgi:hypothetical protein